MAKFWPTGLTTFFLWPSPLKMAKIELFGLLGGQLATLISYRNSITNFNTQKVGLTGIDWELADLDSKVGSSLLPGPSGQWADQAATAAAVFVDSASRLF